MHLKIIFLILAPVAFASCQAESSKPYTIYEIEQRLAKKLFESFSDFQITKIYTRNSDHNNFYKTVLGTDILQSTTDIEKQEFFFKPLTDTNNLHLGVAVFTYPDKTSAEKALSSIETSGFFKNTKILTRYQLVNHGKTNILAYTESSADKRVLSYLEAIIK